MDQRPARAEDADVIGAYHHRCWIEGYAGLVDGELLAALRPEEQIERWRTRLADPDHGVVVLVDGTDRPVGHVFVDGDTITNIYVDPEAWGGGIGRSLLAVGEGLLRDAGHDVGVLWTIAGNRRAIGLYESAGWTLDGTLEVHAASNGIEVPELRMVKTLVTSAA